MDIKLTGSFDVSGTSVTEKPKRGYGGQPGLRESKSEEDASTEPRELTRREKQTLKLIAEGHSNRVIAEIMEISAHTAKYHVNNLFAKLGASNRAQLAAMAVRIGLA